MELIKKEWTGSWNNFECYIESEEPHLIRAWQEAEAAVAQMPMFRQGAKAFWQMACRTVTQENPHKLSGWNVSENRDGITIEWLAEGNKALGKYDYHIECVIEKGLEAKPNFLFCAGNAPEGCPFCFLLAMEPMPERSAYLEGGYVSHLHFQFAGKKKELITEEGRLVNPGWYATMCAKEGSLLEQCNIIRGLHRLPKWEELPEL